MAKKNLKAIVEAWAPTIEKITNGAVTAEKNYEKLSFLAQIAHNQKEHLNEAAGEVGGAFFPYQNLANTMGVGNPMPAQQGGMTGADQMSPRTVGSGDKWPSLLPIALQVAARTVGFEFVHNTPFSGPSGVIPFMDFVYGGSKLPYGATPSRDASTANPAHKIWGKDKAWGLYGNAACFRARALEEGEALTGAAKRQLDASLYAERNLCLVGEDASLAVEYIGLSRLSADLMFRVVGPAVDAQHTAAPTLGELFEGEVSIEGFDVTLDHVRPISMLEDQILGYAGSGKYDDDRWSGTFQNPFHLFEPMNRATGEMQYPRQLSLTMKTKYVEVGKIQIAFAVTREQVQDLQKQWGIDVVKMIENQAINELSQTINKHILSRLFALGWLNHVEAYEAEGINLNLNMDAAAAEARQIGFATYQGDDVEPDEANECILEMPLPAMKNYGDFENLDTRFARVPKLIKTAGNVIFQRGRRGPGTFVVTNWKIGSILQDTAQYSFAPIANTFNQNNGQLYPVGTLAGMTVYVDPMMRTDDTRVLVGRKGDKQEPGVHFCPYIMADSVNFIAEGTMAPKAVIQSRYALVNVGWYPETQYLTLFVNTPEELY